jgi:hypothetical protein
MMKTDQSRSMPDIDRLSTLIAIITLAYTLTHFANFPEQDVEVQLPGFYFSIPINVDTLTALLVAGLMAAGADWLLGDHPSLHKRISFQHWILPALTTLVIGIPLNQLPYGITWWVGLFAGAALLTLILIAEYIAVDAEDVRQPLAAVGLSAVSFTLFLILAIALREANLRLFYTVPALTIAVWLVCLRALHLRLHGEWTVYEAGIIALIVGQLAAAFHYWPFSPISFGLAILGPAYALTSLFSSLIEEKPFPQMLVEPLTILILTWGVALWIG